MLMGRGGGVQGGGHGKVLCCGCARGVQRRRGKRAWGVDLSHCPDLRRLRPQCPGVWGSVLESPSGEGNSWP